MKRLFSLGVVLLMAGCGDKSPGGAIITPVAAEDARDEGPSVSPDGSMIAFWRPSQAGMELWVADRDLGNARNLQALNLFGGNVVPIWSPDGKELLIPAGMRSLADVALVSVADGQVTWLTESPALEIPIQFHPDGDRIVFVAYTAGGSVETFTVSRSTRVIAPLLAGLETPHVGLVSPDGSHVAYTEFGGGRSTIWVRSVDGGEPRQLTTDGFEAIASLTVEQAWSPDGREFLFVSSRTGKGDVWIGTTDGNVRQLTTDINSDNAPSFSPDGKWVAFHSDRGRQGDIWVVPAAGGEAIRVTDDLVQEEQVRWIGPATLTFLAANSPAALWRRRLDDQTETRLTPDSIDPGGFWTNRDRSRMAFLIDRPGANNDLAVMDLSSGAIRIVSRDAQHQDVEWNPSGTHVAFDADQSGSLDVYVANASADPTPRRLTDWPGFERVLGWSPDGRSVTIVSDREARLGDMWEVPLDGGAPVRLTRFESVINGTSLVHRGQPRTYLVLPDSASGELELQELLPSGALRKTLGGNPGGLYPSPDGEFLGAQVAGAGGALGLVLRPDGSVVQELGPGAFARSFSRDGNRVVFSVRRGNNRDLMMMDLTTGTSEPVTSTPGDETHAEFSADETSIVLRRVQVTRQIMRADLSAMLP